MFECLVFKMFGIQWKCLWQLQKTAAAPDGRKENLDQQLNLLAYY